MTPKFCSLAVIYFINLTSFGARQPSDYYYSVEIIMSLNIKVKDTMSKC